MHVVGHVVENAQAVLLAANLQHDVARRGAKALAGLQRASAAAAEAEAVALLPGGGDRADRKRSSRRGHSRGGSIGSIARRAKSGVLYSSILLEEYRE